MVLKEDEEDIVDEPENEPFDDVVADGDEESGDESFGFGDSDSFGDEGGDEDEFGSDDEDEDEFGSDDKIDDDSEVEEDIIDRITNFVNSKNSFVNKDGKVVTGQTYVTDLENSENIEDNISGFLSKLKDPDSEILKYVKFDKDNDKYTVDVDDFFRKKANEYTSLNAQEKLDRIQDDIYYLVKKFTKIYDKNISMIKVPNEILPSIKNKFGDSFDDVYHDIETDKYDDYLDGINNNETETEKADPSEEQDDEEFVWENKMGFKKIDLPTRIDEDNYYANSKGELLELGFIEKDGWFIFVGDYLKLAVNIDFDVVVTSNFNDIIDTEYTVEEKTFTNNIADGIIFSSGLIGKISDLDKESQIMKQTFDIADKVKTKLFG